MHAFEVHAMKLLGWFGSESELSGALVEDDELGLKEDVAVDGETNTSVALHTTETG